MTGKPSKENWGDKTTLKFTATDGHHINEDLLVINPSKLGFLTIFLEVMKLMGPLITLSLFLYRFRVKIHTIIFYKRFDYGTDTYIPLKFY